MSIGTKTPAATSVEARRALLAQRLRKAVGAAPASPLSFGQQRLWFLDQLEPESALYNIPTLARITGMLDRKVLEQALNAVVARHEVLRTRFECRDEEPMQIIEERAPVQLDFEDLSGQTEAEREREAQRLTHALVNRPFDLHCAPLLRAKVIRLKPDEHLLVLVLHHVVADEWSLRVLFQELKICYEALQLGRHPNLPELPIQYADYAAWQQEWLRSEGFKKQLRYWQEQVSGTLPMLELRSDQPRQVSPSFRGAQVVHALNRELTEKVRRLAQEQDATLFMLLLATLQVLLHRYTGQEEIVVASPIAGRNRVETENLIGFFVNTLLLRANTGGDPTFAEQLNRVRRATLDAYANQDLPFEKLVEHLQPDRSLTHLPFTRVMFVVQNSVLEELQLGSARLEFLPVATDTAKFDLTVVMQETSSGLVARAEYNTDLFQGATIERLLQHLATLLEGITANPATRISQLPLLTESERRQLLIEWNDTASDYPRSKCLHELFEAQAARCAEARAVAFGHAFLTYGELNARANQLAHYLRKMNVGPDVPVAIAVERSLDSVVGLLAILKAGGAYVPLDAGYPKDRLAFMLEDTRSPVLLTQQKFFAQLPAQAGSVICLDADWDLIARESRTNPVNTATPENLAYVMYTSGSTGLPKGVAIPHRAVARLVLNTNYIQLDATDRIAQVSNVSFDAATFEIWGALLNGGLLIGISQEVMLSPKLCGREIEERGITAMFLTTAVFNQLAAEAPGALGGLRTLIVGGEALDPKWVGTVLKHKPPQRLVNGYGPTENTTFTCCFEIRALPEGATNVPIGRPLANTQVYILDNELNPVPIGVPGELYTGGDGLARGYWNRPELTREKFISNPFTTKTASPLLYKTGDLARYLSDGNIEFLGRIDHQVKIRGFRIELGEIESVLGVHPGVRECIVAVKGNGSGTKRLVAYYVPANGSAPNASELRRVLGEKLPDYMVPAAFMPLKSFPLTPNGKVDRRNLPDFDGVRPELERKYVPPRDDLERQLTAIWEKVLGINPIGVQDKFFELGGHSLLAVKVIAQIEKTLGKKLRLATIFQAPTVEQLAAVLREGTTAQALSNSSSLVEIQSQGSLPPLFLVHGAGGGMFWGYVNLSRNLGNEQPVYGFKSRGLDGLDEFARIEEIAAQYVADLRRLQPQGPYRLGGYCFGGIVAFEMARQLAAEHHEVELLALFNCAPPNSRYTRIPWTPRWGVRFLRNLVYWGNYCRQWSSSQRREFVRWKWSLLKKRVGRVFARSSHGDLAQVDAGDLVDLSSYTGEQRSTWEAHIRALLKFQPQPFGGRVHLFRSPGHPLWCSFDPDYGWSDLAKGGVEITIVPGAHEKILEEPCVEMLARELSMRLNQAADKKATPNELSQVASESSREASDGPETGCCAGGIAQRAEITGESQAADAAEHEDLQYWEKQLKSPPPLLDLPSDRPLSPDRSRQIARMSFSIPQPLCESLKQLSRQQSCELSTVLLAGFVTVLHRYTAATDIIMGSSVAREFKPGNQHHPFPLRCDLSGNPSFKELVQRLEKGKADASAHSRVRWDGLVRRLGSERDLSPARFFQVSFWSEEQSPHTGNGSHGKSSVSEVNALASELALSLRLTRTAAEFSGWCEYSVALFNPDRITRLVGHFLTVLAAGVERHEEQISHLPLLAGTELEQLRDWNRTEKEYSKDKSLADLFLEQADRTPGAEALVSGITRLSYRELRNRATQIASHLQTMGLVRGDLVGICLHRSPDMVAAILGTLIAGGAYVPLDPAYPAERLAFILQDAEAGFLLTEKSLAGLLPKGDAQTLELDSLAAPTAGAGHCLPAAPAKPSDLAYVIYTSGSTGRPKGVALEHRSAVALVSWAKEIFSAGELSGVLACTSICFDLSIFEMFVPLSWGGKMILADNALALSNLPAAEEVKLVNTVPSAMRELIRLQAVPRSVQVINLAGEPLAQTLVEQIYKETSARKVYDLYGPTETTVYSTFALRSPGQSATIGRPLANERVFILDQHLQLVPQGVPGELYIGGDGLARGYLNRPELTAERFVRNPFEPGARLYRTGDLARWRADGNLEYLGRLDHQVKIRGFRVELGEIETTLRRHASVREAVVVAREDKPGDQRLIAYLVGPKKNRPAKDELRRMLGTSLPEHMVPSAFVWLDQLPLTPNGKVDRKALPAPERVRDASASEHVGASTSAEEQVLAIWREVLGVPDIGVRDNFFELGGHSLLATQVISRLRDLFRAQVPLSAFFATPTIEGLAEGLTRGVWSQAAPSLAPSRVDRTGLQPVSFVQERLWFLAQLEPGSAAYNVPAALRLQGKLDVEALERALRELLGRHESLRTNFAYRDGHLMQTIAPRGNIEIQKQDFRTVAGDAREELVQQWVNGQAQRPFDLERGPLMRADLAQLSEVDHILLVTFHHAISDGWSLANFFLELQACYDAFADGLHAPALPALPMQYVDFAAWQRQWMQGPVLEQEVAYWRDKLRGAPPTLELPTDYPLSEKPSGKADRRTAILGVKLSRDLSDLSRVEGCTPFMVLMTALAITLHKWSSQADLVLGTVVAGRTRREFEQVLGCFMNFLPLRTRIMPGDSGRQMLTRMKATVLEGQTHQECPFEKIVEAANPERRLNRNPLYNVALLLQNFPAELFASKKLQARRVPVSLEAALLDLRFEVEPGPQGLAIACEYRTDLFSAGTIDALLAAYLRTLELLTRQPDAQLTAFVLTPDLQAQARTARPAVTSQAFAITATFTAEPLAEPLRYWIDRLELSASVEFAPYNQVFQELLTPGSLLAGNTRGLNVILIRLQDWLRSGGAPNQTGADEPEQHMRRNAREFVTALRTAVARGATPYLVGFCPASNAFLADPRGEALVRELEAALVTELEGIAGVHVLSGGELARWYPVADYDDPSGEQLGHVPYTPVFFTGLATGIVRKFHALCRPALKVIALDCDQTLWSGVCGEDGPQGLRLEAERLALQEFMRGQLAAGRLLCLCSKNNEEDVYAVFTQRADMPLRLEHFAAQRLNWMPKSENLKALARELGLGLDSFVLLDDNPVECAEAEANCPEVLALQLPSDLARVPRFLQHCWVFDHPKLTSEDKRRSEMYRQNRQREQLRSQVSSLEDFIAGLELKINIEPMRPEQLARVAQLTQRTNQFNCAPVRLNEAEVQTRLAQAQVLTVSVSDRFGDYGLAGVMICRMETSVIEVDAFLLSCRVLGRGVEHRMLARLGEMARERSAEWVSVHFARSTKNKPAFDFLESVGSQFRQALNGGYVFRFPAGFAQDVVFKSASVSPAPSPAEWSTTATSPTPAFPALKKFTGELALEADDAAKIHQALEAQTVLRAGKSAEYRAPGSDLEWQLCELWQKLLYIEQVGVRDNFFELGGHSLLAVRLFAEIEKLVGRKLPLVTLFQAPTIEQLAPLLSPHSAAPADSLLVPIQPHGAQPPLFLVHGAGGDVLWGYANLAAHLPKDQPVYGIKSRGQVGLEEPRSIEEMAATYLAAVQAFQQRGPYYLGGYCFGGNVAYEMSRQLQSQGEAVAIVALIDSAPANAGYEKMSWWRPEFSWRFVRNFRYWFKDFLELPSAERRRFIARKSRWIGRKLKRRFWSAPDRGQVDLEEVIELTHFPKNELKLWQLHLQALIEHIEKPYAGPVTLLRTAGQPLFCSLREDFCWGELVRGDLLVKPIPGSHENIFIEPNVEALAAELTNSLAQARERFNQ